MKRLGITVLLSCFMIYGCSKEYTEMDVISSHNTAIDKWYKLDIDVIVDKDNASDKDACSKEIIQHILDNDFHSIHFSFDKNGYPNEVTVDVFTSKENIQKGKKSYWVCKIICVNHHRLFDTPTFCIIQNGFDNTVISWKKLVEKFLGGNNNVTGN